MAYCFLGLFLGDFFPELLLLFFGDFFSALFLESFLGLFVFLEEERGVVPAVVPPEVDAVCGGAPADVEGALEVLAVVSRVANSSVSISSIGDAASTSSSSVSTNI